MTETEIPTPDWVPPIVCHAANAIAGAMPDMPEDTEALLIRLLTDERMKEVWEEISKHKRIDHKTSVEWFYPVSIPGEIGSWTALAQAWRQHATGQRSLGDGAGAAQFEDWASAANRLDSGSEPADEDAQRALAMALLLCLTVGHFNAGLRTIRKSDLDRVVDALRADGEAEKADAYVRTAAESANAPFFVIRQRTDARIEAFVKGIAARTKSIFGTSLYGVLAILTNVAFGVDYDQQRIRVLLR
jgi:hypothetical protein